jgi:hypothetical protein
MLLYPKKRSEIPGHAPLYKTYLGKDHQSHKKPAQPKGETNALATRMKSNIINRKETPSIQSSTENLLDLWHSGIGSSLIFQH